MKNEYIKVTEPHGENGFVVTVDEAVKELRAITENAQEGDDSNSYTFTVVFLTPEEFHALPEFTGF